MQAKICLFFRFADNKDLKEHSRKVHFRANSDKKLYVDYKVPCNFCKKTFKNEAASEAHFKLEHRDQIKLQEGTLVTSFQPENIKDEFSSEANQIDSIVKEEHVRVKQETPTIMQEGQEYEHLKKETVDSFDAPTQKEPPKQGKRRGRPRKHSLDFPNQVKPGKRKILHYSRN